MCVQSAEPFGVMDRVSQAPSRARCRSYAFSVVLVLPPKDPEEAVPMNKLLTTACALAMGIAWGTAPAIAQESTKDKVEGAWDKTKSKTEETCETRRRARQRI
jgi:hypothetical protein